MGNMPEGTGGRFVLLLGYKARQFPLADAPARSVGPVPTNIEQYSFLQATVSSKRVPGYGPKLPLLPRSGPQSNSKIVG
jgi:hypothetical protein